MRLLLKLLLLSLLAVKPLTCSSLTIIETYPGEAVEETRISIFDEPIIYRHGIKSLNLVPPVFSGFDCTATFGFYTNSVLVEDAYELGGEYVRRTYGYTRPTATIFPINFSQFTFGNLQYGVSSSGISVVAGASYTNDVFSFSVKGDRTYNFSHPYSLDATGIGYEVLAPATNTICDYVLPWLRDHRETSNFGETRLYPTSQGEVIVPYSANSARFLNPIYYGNSDFSASKDPSGVDWTLNPNFEWNELNFSCFNVWHNRAGWQNGRGAMCYLVSPSFAFGMKHSANATDYTLAPGDEVAFVGTNGTLYVRTISERHMQPGSEDENAFYLLEFDQALPGDVVPAWVPDFGDKWADGDLWYTGMGLVGLHYNSYRCTRLVTFVYKTGDQCPASNPILYNPPYPDIRYFESLHGREYMWMTNSASTFPPVGYTNYYGNHAVTGDSSSPTIIPAHDGKNVVVMKAAASTGVAGSMSAAIGSGSNTGGPSLVFNPLGFIDWAESIINAGGESITKETFEEYDDVIPWRHIDYMRFHLAEPGADDYIPAWNGETL